MQHNKSITGIILAGGKSKRMGTEKGLVHFRGKALIEYAIDALLPVCNQILISANSNSFHSYGFSVIEDEIPDSGPMGGIYSCMKLADNDLCFVLSCDTPMVNSSVVKRILHHVHGFDAAMPWYETHFFEPLCAVYQKSLLQEFEHFIQMKDFKILNLVAKVNMKKIEIGESSGIEALHFYNVNSKKQLEELENLTPAKFQNNVRVLPNLLMIAGTGRNVGKTTLSCTIIEHLSTTQDVVGVKISPHMHRQNNTPKIIVQTPEYLIIEETKTDLQKDSSRMLRAGAAKVYYLQTNDRHIQEPFTVLMNLIPDNQAVVCESGALLSYAKPGIFLLVKAAGNRAFKEGVAQLPYNPDRWVTFDGQGFDLEMEEIIFESNTFALRQK